MTRFAVVAFWSASMSCWLSGCVSPEHEFHALLDEAWNTQMRWSPTWATTLGDHRFDDKLADLSLDAHDRRTARLEKFRGRLGGIPRQLLDPEDRRTAELFDRYLDARLLDQRCRGHLTPINQMGGPHQSLPLLLVSQPFHDYQDYMNYGARLAAFPAQVEQIIECMKAGMALGHVPPRLTIEPVLEQLAAHMVDDPDKSELYKPTARFPESFDDLECVELAGMLWHTIEQAVVPAYRRLHEFVEDSYLPTCRDTIGIWDVPDGDRIYDDLVARHTTTDRTPEDIHQLGLDELKRIHAEMEGIRQEIGFEGPLAEFLTHMREDPRDRAPSGSWLMTQYAAILERTTKQLPGLFGRLPKAACVVKEIEAYRAASSPVGYYNPSAPDGSRPGYFYVNTYQPKERVTYTMEALTYHEAVPGHHFQFALHAENESLPMFRRHNYLTAYSEGWALYTEGLGEHLGGYKDPLQRFGRLTYDAWRAARLVVDTGIHRFLWTR